MITSLRNPRVAAAVRLHRGRGRREAGATLLEGPTLFAEAVAAGADVTTVFGLPDDAASRRGAASLGAEWTPVGADVLRKLSTTREPQSPVAVLTIPSPALPAAGHLLAAWGLGDPGNTGTLLRTAAAFGLGFAAGPGTADLWSPKVLRSAMGGHWRTGCGNVTDLGDLRGSERVLAATVVAGGAPPQALRDAGPVALLIGEEAAGLSPAVVAAADLRVTIPMPGGTESLNAAAAGAILAYELSGGGRGAPSGRD